MKIALISPYDYSYPGGVVAHISNLADNFSNRGHEVKIIAPYSRRVSCNQQLIRGGKPTSVPIGGSIARVALSPTTIPRIKRILDTEKFDIVHIHEPFTPVLPVAALYFSNSVNIGTFHACHRKPRGYTFFKLLLNWFHHKLDGRIAVSNSAKDFVCHCFPADYRIIPNGIDWEHFSKPPAEPLTKFKDGKFNILFVGRLEKRKGLIYLLKAFSVIKEKYPNTRLIIVGPGTRLRKAFEKFIVQNNIADVTFTGFIPYQELPAYYNTADLFCAPSTGGESFGIVLLEAMAAGKPIIASNIEGYLSVLASGEEGLLVPPQDVSALADGIEKLMADRELRLKMGEKGKLKAEQYAWHRVADKVMDYYLESREKKGKSSI